jgi:hypothetical protein
MKKYFSVLLLAFCTIATSAKSPISGIVKDRADGSTIPFATAALLRTDSTTITGVIANNDGKFVLENVATGEYLLQISFIGYDRAYQTVNVPEQSDIGEIYLSENANMLQEVVITGRRQLIEHRLDRTVINVADNMITSGLNVQDLLKQLPGLVVDQDGNIKLNGRTATVYIDGRPTRLPAEQVAQMLNGMIGDVVDRVELIDNPSSRYEAGMSSAIVNIRLKRDASLGVNGSVSGGLGFNDYNLASRGGLNLNYRSKRLNIFGNYGYDNRTRVTDLYQNRNYNGEIPVTYSQNSFIKGDNQSHTLRTGVDYFINSKQTIGFLFNGAHHAYNGNIEAEATISQTGSTRVDSIELSNSDMASKHSSQMYNLNYRLNGDSDKVFTVDLDYGRVYNHSWQNMQHQYLNANGSERRPSTEFQYGGPRNIDILSLKADFSKPFSEKSNFEAGARVGQTTTDNEIIYENLLAGKWEIDDNQSNRFKYTEQVSAAYTTYSHKFGKFSAMAGLRAEYTSIEGNSPTMNSTFKRSYLGWFPSAYVQYQINEKQGLNLSYSRKIDRPNFGQLNPFRMYIDPFTFASGNPDLNPQYRNTIALRYNISGYSANLIYTHTSDLFQRDFVQDDENRTLSIIPKNVGKSETVGLNIFAPIEIAKWYKLNAYSQATYNMVDTRLSGEEFKKNYLAAYASLQHSFTILPTLRANVFMDWVKTGWFGVYQTSNTQSMNVQVEKSFLDKRLNVALSCDDIFNTNSRFIAKVDFANMNQSIRENNFNRMVMVTARYNFGSQQIRGARSRSVGIEDEMGRAR